MKDNTTMHLKVFGPSTQVAGHLRPFCLGFVYP
jgi:hypothetical protein